MKRNLKGQFLRRTTGLVFEGFGIWFDKKGYACICLGGKDIKLHRYIWEKQNGVISKGFQLHHKDYNKSNWRLDNLELVTQSDHLKIHAGWKRENGKWIAKSCKNCKKYLSLDKFYPRKGLTPSSLCKSCSSEYFKKRNTEEYKAKRKIYMKKYYLKIKEKEGARG